MPPKRSAIRTFRMDAASEIEGKGISQTDIALAEERRRRETAALAPKRAAGPLSLPSARTIIIALGVLIILGSLGFGVYSFFFAPKTASTVAVAAPETAIFAEKTTKVDLSGVETLTDALTKLLTLVTSGGERNKIEYFYFALTQNGIENIVGAQSFFGAFLSRAPATFIRSLGNAFMYATYTTEKRQPFLLLSIDSYESAYAGMLSWEGTIESDLLPLFGISPGSLPAGEPTWKDDALRNTDIRRELDANGNTILLYSFLDQHTLLITQSDVVFYEVLGRLHTPKPVIQ